MEKDPGRWSLSAGVCRTCGGPIHTRFPTRSWKSGDPTFDYFHRCPNCDGCELEVEAA
jgi:hypothetical protein